VPLEMATHRADARVRRHDRESGYRVLSDWESIPRRRWVSVTGQLPGNVPGRLFLRIGGRSVPFGRSAESGFAVDNRPFILNLKAEVLRPSLA
jgi:hypothetical protein